MKILPLGAEFWRINGRTDRRTCDRMWRS